MKRPGHLGITIGAVIGLGCAGIAERGADCMVQPVEVARLAPLLPLRAQIRFEDIGAGAGVEVVAASEAGELIVVGLGPYGVRLFSIQQSEGAPRVESTPWTRAGPPPLWVFDVLQRVFWIEPPAGFESGNQAVWQHGRERVVEDLGVGDHLRRFSRGRDGEEEVVVEYAADANLGGAQVVKIYNPWCGYTGHVVALNSGATGEMEREAE